MIEFIYVWQDSFHSSGFMAKFTCRLRLGKRPMRSQTLMPFISISIRYRSILKCYRNEYGRDQDSLSADTLKKDTFL